VRLLAHLPRAHPVS